jgi:hypothetical protein
VIALHDYYFYSGWDWRLLVASGRLLVTTGSYQKASGNEGDMVIGRSYPRTSSSYLARHYCSVEGSRIRILLPHKNYL